MADRDLAAGLIVFRLIPDTSEAAAEAENNATPKQQIQYLLLQKSGDRKHNWGPPKGYAKAGESDESCALRETQEETGLTANDLSVLNEFSVVLNYVAWRRNKRVKYWPARVVDAERGSSIKISPEHGAYEWFDINEATRTVFGRDMKAELQKCDAYLKNLYGID